jgi:hypothetical protein
MKYTKSIFAMSVPDSLTNPRDAGAAPVPPWKRKKPLNPQPPRGNARHVGRPRKVKITLATVA